MINFPFEFCDLYLITKPMQPKAHIARDVARFGYKIPQIYSTLEEAILSGRPFLIRSEHPEEYAHASNLLETKLFNPKDSVEKAQKFMLESRKSEKVRKYCNYLGKDLEGCIAQISHSFWEYIPGLNGTIVADSAVEGRYHIILKGDIAGKNKDKKSYCVFENGEILHSLNKELCNEVKDNISRLQEWYEGIRRLPIFNPIHCPSLEFQLGDDGELYFLQYHRTRDFQGIEQFPKKKKKELLNRGYQRVEFVRGKYEGELVVNLGLYDEEEKEEYFLDNYKAAFDINVPDQEVYREIQSRRRSAYLFDKTFDKFMQLIVMGRHITNSMLFKPEISVSLDLKKLVGKEVREELVSFMFEDGCCPIILDIHSDGREGFVKYKGLA